MKLKEIKKAKIEATFTNWWLEAIEVFVIAILVIAGILYKSGTLTSGYHFADDHELIKIEYALKVKGESLLSVMGSLIKGDLWWRYRPFYWVERATATALFGSDLFLWNCYTAVKGVLTFCLLYFGVRNTKRNKVCSFLFAAIVMLGSQFAPWYRSANQENTGLFFCAFIIWLITLQYARKAFHNIPLNILITVSALVCSLIKESFMLFIPALLLMKFWLEYISYAENDTPRDPLPQNKKGNNLSKNLETAKKCFKNSWYVYAVTVLVELFNVYMILFVVGVDHVSYAGFEKSVSLKEYLSGIQNSLFIYTKWYTLFGILCILILCMCYDHFGKKKWNKLKGLVWISICAMGIQLAAHARSQMVGRYIIPYILAYGFLIVVMGYMVFEKDVFRRRLYTAILAVLLLLGTNTAYRNAQAYAYDGSMTNAFLESMLSVAGEDAVVGAFTDEELNLSMSCYLEAKGKTKGYSYSYTDGSLTDQAQFSSTNEEPGDWSKVRAAGCYANNIQTVTQLMGITEESQYTVQRFGNYCIVLRNEM